jgi:outer membrane biosynthesis protein TonB
MTVQIIIGGEDGVEAARELMLFVSTIREGFGAGVVTPIASTAPTPPATPDIPETSDAKDSTSVEPKLDTPEEKPTEAANDDVANRRKSRPSPKKKDEPAPENATPTEQPPMAAKEPEPQPAFTPPAGINEVLSETGSAPSEVQDQAKKMRDSFAPKEGESPSANYCRATLLYLATVKGMDAGRKIFEGMGVQGIKALPPERFPDFIALAEKALAA